MLPKIVQVALPVPLDREFDYLLMPHQFPVIGGRVRVPFGKQTHIGIITAFKQSSEFDEAKLKTLTQILDLEPLWNESELLLLNWCSQYYQYPLGETYSVALAGGLRKGKPAQFDTVVYWEITDLGRNQLALGLKRAKKQAELLHQLAHGEMLHSDLNDKFSSNLLKIVEEKGWIKKLSRLPSVHTWQDNRVFQQDKPKLNHEQAIAIATINACQKFGCFLIEGVTGSGKTEVYLNTIEPVVAKNKQALVLVPEIGLTPQTIHRFKSRFNVPVTVIHSALNETEKLNAWLEAKSGQAGIVIGTRSALFTPFKRLGIIIVDEEHDGSYKQQDSLRYHARDVAVMRANKEQVPILLGSATPSLETLHNALSGKYHHLTLTQRAGNASMTSDHILNIKGEYLDSGLSASLIAKMRYHLNEGNQVMLFLNRRGFSPAMMCHDCGWTAECQRCDAYYTFHQHSREMRCHRCGSGRSVVSHCQSCGSQNLVTVGVGTEQLEVKLHELFPEYQSIRIDRDSTRRKGSLQTALDKITKGEYQILIGTQMLAKGHHFPNVTLVGLLDVDASLYSSDFRAAEKLAQLYVQVAGRAGRASKPGEVLLQTHHPEHPLLQTLVQYGYGPFARQALIERSQAGLPPFSYLALVRAEANQPELVERFLRQVRHIFEASPLFGHHAVIMGPTPAPIAKRAGKSRWQLLLQTEHRSTLLQWLNVAKPAIALLDTANKVRWGLDIEPQDFI